MRKPLLLSIFTAFGSGIYATTTLYNGAQEFVFTSSMSTSCSSAFNTSLNCESGTIQLVTYNMATVEWNTSSLTSLCTSACNSSLSVLSSAINSGCAGESFFFNNANTTYDQFIDHFQYKYDLICLKDSSSGQFCTDIEDTWNITTMLAEGKATWPNNTEKEYIDIDSGGWGPLLDVGDTPIYPYNDYLWINASDVDPEAGMKSLDYYMERGGIVDDDNYGWFLPLDLDEYPLEIQCSECFLNKFLHGITSVWGDVWDEITEQVWSNVMLNCDLNFVPVPAHNLSGPPPGIDSIANINIIPQNTSSVYCPQSLAVTNDTSTCYTFCMANGVATAAIQSLSGGLSCQDLLSSDTPVCAPLSCSVAVVDQYMDYHEFVDGFDNMTYVQFLAWNPYIHDPVSLLSGEVVCIGPPGEPYTPATATNAFPLVYTTTATPNLPTPSGTIDNCGRYYAVVAGDDCDTVSLNFSITFSQLVAMNPSLNTECTNLLAGEDYCVALVNGTTLIIPSTTATPSTTPSSISSGPVVTPTPHQPNMVLNCNKFDICVSGDSCSVLATRNGITIDQLEAWNPDVGTSCTFLDVGDWYCVGLEILSTTSSTTPTTTSSASITTPTPHQPNMVAGCNKFDICVSGDSCSAMAIRNDITVDQVESWNPDVGTSCSFLDVGDWYCVGLGTSSPTTTANPSTTSSASVMTPTPHQPNMVAGCNRFDICVSGDNCSVMASRNGVTAEEIETWNPDVGATCEFLDVGDWYCVGLIA